MRDETPSRLRSGATTSWRAVPGVRWCRAARVAHQSPRTRPGIGGEEVLGRAAAGLSRMRGGLPRRRGRGPRSDRRSRGPARSQEMRDVERGDAPGCVGGPSFAERKLLRSAGGRAPGRSSARRCRSSMATSAAGCLVAVLRSSSTGPFVPVAGQPAPTADLQVDGCLESSLQVTASSATRPGGAWPVVTLPPSQDHHRGAPRPQRLGGRHCESLTADAPRAGGRRSEVGGRCPGGPRATRRAFQRPSGDVDPVLERRAGDADPPLQRAGCQPLARVMLSSSAKPLPPERPGEPLARRMTL